MERPAAASSEDPACREGHAAGRRRSSVDAAAAPVRTVGNTLAQVLLDLEQLGIVCQLAGKVVGGVAMTASYYQHVLLTEGRAADDVASCQLLITRAHKDGVAMMPVTQAQLEEGHPFLPAESPVLSKIMSPAALSDLHWARVPAVCIFGCFVADEDELQEAAAAGIPISPSMKGPYLEELKTQVEVFFKQHAYPDSKCFLLRDWGFLLFGSDLADAVACFNAQLKGTLTGEPGGGGAAAAAGAGPGLDGAAAAPKTLQGVLAHALRRLQARVGMLRTQSLPAEDEAQVSDGGGIKSPKSPKSCAAARPLATAASEPSSPMVLAGDALDALARNPSCASHRNSSEGFRVPSFQTGFKPW